MAKSSKTTRKVAAKSSAKAARKASPKPTNSAVAKKPAAKSKKSASKSKSNVTYKLGTGQPAPSFDAPATSGRNLRLSDFKGHSVVLYFYPKDNTPGCTLEGQDFKRLKADFAKAGAEIIGVSQDSVKSHENFKSKCGFPFELLSDESGEICRAFDVIQMKSMYGREFQGIERSTFVIDPKGVVHAEWRKVRVGGHAEEVLKSVQELKQASK